LLWQLVVPAGIERRRRAGAEAGSRARPTAARPVTDSYWADKISHWTFTLPVAQMVGLSHIEKVFDKRKTAGLCEPAIKVWKVQ